MVKYAPEELLKIIKATAKKLKRAPAKRELKEITECCVGTFGSWNKAIIATGLIPNRSHSQRMYRRINTKARDGHLCDSISEAIVDDWLSERSIYHERNVLYPDTRHRTDWAIGKNTFIEYFGLVKDSPRYDRAIREKRKLCRKNDIRLIEITADDLSPVKNIDARLAKVLKDLMNPAGKIRG